MKTRELIGKPLDWAVAKCSGPTMLEFFYRGDYKPSTDWEQGGPIIEREDISIDTNLGSFWYAYKRPCKESQRETGSTPLIAAMKCYVASKMGEDIDVPEGL